MMSFQLNPSHCLKAAAIAFVVLVLFGCVSPHRVNNQLAQQMSAGNFPAALQIIEQEKNGLYRGKNRLLYFLERGMLLHVSGQYTESNAAFEHAKRIGRELYTKSISRAGLSLMTNDNSLAYAGENFERTLIHLFSALNYVALADSSAALVEVRQVGEYLRKLQVDSPNQNVYQEDAFARYLSALLYEGSGEYDSAFVDYKKATDAYEDYGKQYSVRRPGSLFPNAERIAAKLGRWAQKDLRKRGSGGQAREIPAGSGELIVLHYNGLAPVKGQTKITIPFSEAWLLVGALQLASRDAARNDLNQATLFASQIAGTDVVAVAFPKYVNRPYSIQQMEPRVAGATHTLGPELVEDIGAIAEKDLQDRIVRIRTKAIVRAAIKYAIQKGAEVAAREAARGEDYGDLLQAGTQLFGNVLRFASEQADQRVWSTLPDQIWMSSMILPAGTHDVQVDFKNAQSMLVESRTVPGVKIAAGDRRFVILRTVK